MSPLARRSADQGSDRSGERYRRAGLSTVAEVVARAVGAAVTLLAVPLTLGYLGTERYGVWMTISSFAALLSFADLGIGSGLITAISRASGLGDRASIQRLSGTAFWLLLLAGLVFVLGVVAASLLIDWADVLNASGPLARSEAAPSVVMFMVCYAVYLWLGTAGLVRRGLQEGYVNSIFTVAGSATAIALLIVVTTLGLGLPFIVAAVMGGPALGNGANTLFLYTRSRWLAPRLRRLDGTAARELFRSGSRFLVLQFAVAAGFYSDSVIAARVVGPEGVAIYSVAAKMFLIPSVLAAAALAPLWPAYGEAIARGDSAWVTKTLRRSIVLSLAITVPVSLALIVFAEPILNVWIGGELRPPFLLVVGMGLWVVLAGIGTAVGTFLNGASLLKVQVVTHALMAVANVALSVYLASRIGVAGVILGTVISYPIFVLIPMTFYARRVVRRMASQDPDAAGAAKPENPSTRP